MAKLNKYVEDKTVQKIEQTNDHYEYKQDGIMIARIRTNWTKYDLNARNFRRELGDNITVNMYNEKGLLEKRFNRTTKENINNGYTTHEYDSHDRILKTVQYLMENEHPKQTIYEYNHNISKKTTTRHTYVKFEGRTKERTHVQEYNLFEPGSE